MRNWIIKYWAYQYDSKVFGKTFRHPRVVNTIMPLFCIAGLINLLVPGFSIFQALVFLPSFIIFFGGTKLFVGQIDYYELDWEQKLQFLQKKISDGEKLSIEETKDYDTFSERFDIIYNGNEKFVNKLRFFIPLIAILVSVIIYGIFGFTETGFGPERFF